MKLAVFSHKLCWTSSTAPSGYATDGGFPFQMEALSRLFDALVVAVPCQADPQRAGVAPLAGHNLSVIPLTTPRGTGLARKLGFPLWVLRNAPAIAGAVRRADAIHAPIPGDVGTIGMLLAVAFGKPCFVRHCGNFLAPRTRAEHFWRWFMERFAGARNVMLATGGAAQGPSAKNTQVRWVFSTSLWADQLARCAVRRDAPTGGRARLIIVCRQEPRKGTDCVLASLPLIARQFPAATLDVVGDGGAIPDLERQAAALGIAGRTHFHGKVGHARVLELLQAADLFVYPTSASEGFPKVILEALASGLPVVTTHVSVLPQLVRAGCGVLLDSTKPAAIAAAADICLSDAARYRAMSARAIEVAAAFSLERWAESIGEHLRAAWGPLRSHPGTAFSVDAAEAASHAG